MSYDSNRIPSMSLPLPPFRDCLVALSAAAACLLGTASPAQTPTAPPAPGGAAAASAEPAFTLTDAVRRAVEHNPEVLARLNAFRAAEGERDAARGGLLPRVDLSAGYGPERRSLLGDYGRRSATLTLTQLLFDGYATHGEVQRLDHTARVRLFEFFDATEVLALEAVRAYFDVSRYRELVRLAEQSFVDHRAVYAHTQRRVSGGISRAVDLEQVTGRLALAEANLLTEGANLHDTSARFQRVVGRPPPDDLPIPPRLTRDIPADINAAIARAQSTHPALRAAIESVRASQAALETRNGAYRPRLDLRLRHDQGSNYTGSIGHNRTTSAELVLSWNLFNGFSDQARERQFASQLDVARELRDKTCRDTRQTLIIAYNDVGKLQEQLEHLRTHAAAVEKALTAYRDQFDIGQRTLLDLLDTENELFQARRAVVNGEHDLSIAYARTHQGYGRLLSALDLRSARGADGAEVDNWSSGDDAARACPVEPIVVRRSDREALLQRAVQTAGRMSTLNARERAIQQAAIVQQEAGAAVPGGAATPALTTAPAVPGAAPAPPAEAAEPAVRQALEGWRAAWSARDLAGYLGSYASDFLPADGSPREAWEKRRRQVVGRAGDVQVTLQDVAVTMLGDDRASTTFVQQYRSSSYRDTVSKTLDWRLEGGRWRITSEMQAPLAAR
jgi:outer membrane protein, adhesin transport system